MTAEAVARANRAHYGNHRLFPPFIRFDKNNCPGTSQIYRSRKKKGVEEDVIPKQTANEDETQSIAGERDADKSEGTGVSSASQAIDGQGGDKGNQGESANNIQHNSQQDRGTVNNSASGFCSVQKETFGKCSSFRHKRAKRGKHFFKYRFLYGEDVTQQENPGFKLEEVTHLPPRCEGENPTVEKWKNELAFWMWEHLKRQCCNMFWHRVEIDGTHEATIRVTRRWLTEEEDRTGVVRTDSGTELILDELEARNNTQGNNNLSTIQPQQRMVSTFYH